MTATLHQVYLMTADLEASTRFFETALGLERTETGDRSVAFETGSCALKLEADFDASTLAEFGLEPPGANRGDGAVVVLEVDDVRATHDRAVEAGADVLVPPREVPWGRELFLVRSPAGYVIEVSRPT